MAGARSKAGAKNADSKLAVKKGAGKKGKAGKDPNKPKRPASAFFVFMEDFRREYKQKHPNNKSVAAVGKAGGERWKAMSDADKAPYQAKADKRKADYNKDIDAYNKKLAAGSDEEEGSDKSKSEVNDEGDESGSASGGDEDDEE